MSNFSISWGLTIKTYNFNRSENFVGPQNGSRLWPTKFSGPYDHFPSNDNVFHAIRLGGEMEQYD